MESREFLEKLWASREQARLSINLEGQNLERQDLSKTRLESLSPRSTEGYRPPRLSLADLKDAELSGYWCDLQLNSARMDEARLGGLWQRCKFKFVSLKRASMASCDATELLFDRCELQECDFSRAKLRDAQFLECDLSETNFQDADLRGARFHKCRLHDVNWKGAQLDGCQGLSDLEPLESEDAQVLLGECLVLEDFDIPAEWEQAAEEFLSLGSDSERAAYELSAFRYFTLSTKGVFPEACGEDTPQALFRFGQTFFPEECQGESYSRSDFDEGSLSKFLLEYGNANCEERKRSLTAWYELVKAGLFAGEARVSVYDLTNETEHENVEYGIQLLVGGNRAIALVRRWFL